MMPDEARELLDYLNEHGPFHVADGWYAWSMLLSSLEPRGKIQMLRVIK